MTSTDKAAQLHQQIADGVAALGEDKQWRTLLELSARMGSQYSLGNTLLIGLQRPDATVVAGYQAWRKAGRQVRRGEHGILILAPLVRRRTNADDASSAQDAANPGEQDTSRSEIFGVKPVAVFDISQTDGPPIPAATAVDGYTPDGLRDALTAQITNLGYQVRYGDCRPAFGVTSRTDRTVTILPDQPPAQDALTLAHELGHIACGHLGTSGSTLAYTHRGTAEVQAESVAYILTTAAGMNTAKASFDYIGTWAHGDQKLIRDTAETIIRTARRLLHDLGLTLDTDTAPVEPGNAASLAA